MECRQGSTEANPVSGKLLAKNSLWNLLGQALPMLAAVMAMPHLIHALGNERFGVLTIAWMVIGYFSLLDFGIGRATTRSAAEHVASRRIRYIPRLLVTSLILLCAAGIAGAVVMALVAKWLVGTVFVVPAEMSSETRNALYWLAASLPMVLASAAARGVLEARQQFGAVNVIRAAGIASVFVVPLAVVPFARDVDTVVAILVASRAVVLAAYLMMAMQGVRGAHWRVRGRIADARRLVRFGGWLAITTAAGAPMAMGYIDRMVISTLLGVGILTYYATPFEVVTKLWMLPAAVTGVLFPAFVVHANSGAGRLVELHWRAVKFVFLAVAPLAMLIIILSKLLLELWLGKDFAENAGFAVQMLAAGVVFNSLAYVPFSAVQALGRADLTAKRHLVELPLYIAAIYGAVRGWGINGAALTWATWAAIDMVIMFAIMDRLVPIHEMRRRMHIDATLLCGLLAGFAAFGSNLAGSWLAKLLIGIGVLGGMIWCSWYALLDEAEKKLLTSFGGRHAGK